MPNSTDSPILSNNTIDLVSQCKVVVYDWDVKTITLDQGADSELAKATAIDVSSQLLSASFSKNMGSPSGNFSFTLSNSPNYGSGDWKDIIRPGSWCVIYMAQDGSLLLADQVGPPNPNSKKLEEAKKIRCVGFIDRVSVRAEIGENGAFDIVYEVAGRDFGVVYEDTTIWHNVFAIDRIQLDSLHSTALNIVSTVKINKVIELIHDLFFHPRARTSSVNKNRSLLSIALQWLLPRQMLSDIGQGIPTSTSFWGELDNKILEPTEANLAVSVPTDYLSGNSWEVLKRLSVPQFHELFTETNELGLPTLYFRPIPFAVDKSKYPTVGKYVTLYKDLESIEMPSTSVIDFQVGEDNHARYNSFLATVSTTTINIEDNVSPLLSFGFPRHVQDSIKRYGFRPMHVTIDSIVRNADKKDGKSNDLIMVEFNWLSYDYWNNAVFGESGEVAVIGDNRTKVGLALTFDDATPYLSGKRFYIEGYTDMFLVNENGAATWSQSIMVTRGFEEEDLRTKSGFGTRNTRFTREGEYTPAGIFSEPKSRK